MLHKYSFSINLFNYYLGIDKMTNFNNFWFLVNTVMFVVTCNRDYLELEYLELPI